MYRECCIPGCNSNSKRNDIMLHKMPVASEKVMLWYRTLTSVPFTIFEGLTWGEIGKFYVCHKHFEAKYVTRNMRLKPTARPTLFTLEEMASGKPVKNSSAGTGSMEIDCMGISEHSYVRKRHYDHTYAMSAPTNDLAAAGPSHIKSDTVRASAPFSDDQANIAVTEPSAEQISPNPDVPPAKKENKLDISIYIYEDGDAIRTDTCDNDDLPPSPGEVFTTNFVSEIGENIELEDFTKDKIFSWQKADLIEADDSEDPKPAAVPEQPKISEDLTLSLFCEAEPPPLQPAPSELVAVVPEDVEYRCKDCAAIINGFSWWCVRCGRGCGALCGACAVLAPHDAHHVLRAPPATSHNQTQAVLAVIREQLLKENLLYGTDDDGVKVEVKQEPEERPLSPPLPAATPDPLAMELHTDPFTEEYHIEFFTEESHTDPFNVESQPDTFNEEFTTNPFELEYYTEPLNEELHTDPFTVEFYPEDPDPINVELHLETRADESLDNEAINHHPLKRPRLMDSQKLKTSTVISKEVLRRSILKVPARNQGESQTVQTAPSQPGISQDVILATTTDLSGSQTALNITTSDPSGSQTVVKVTPSDLKRLQAFLQAAASDPRISQGMLKAITSDLAGLETILQGIPSDHSESQTALQEHPSDPTGSETVLQVDGSDLNASETILQIDPSDLKRLQDLLNSDSTGSETVLQVDPSNLSGSQIVLQDPSDLKRLQDLLNSDSTGSETVLRVGPSNLSGSQIALQDPSDLKRLQDLLNSDSTGSETVLQVDPSNLSGSQIVLQDPSDLKRLQDFLNSHSTGSETVLQVDPSKLSGSHIVLQEPSDLKRLQDLLNSHSTESETVLQVDPSNLSGSQIILHDDPNDQFKSQTVLQLDLDDPKGLQDFLSLCSNDPTLSQTVLQIDRNDLRRLQDVLQGTNSDPFRSETVQKVDPSNFNELQTSLQDDPIDHLGSQTVLQLPSYLKGSQTAMQIDPNSDLQRLPDVLRTTDPSIRTASQSLPKATPSNRTGSQSLPKVTPSSCTVSQSLLKATLSDSTGSKSLLKVTSSDRTGSQSLLKGAAPSDCTGSRALPNIIARNRGASQSLKVISSSLTKSQAPDKIQPAQLMMSQTPQIVKHSDLSGSKTQQKSQQSILRKSQTVLQVKKLQNKGAPVLRFRQNDPEGSRIEIPQNIPRDKSIPLKVTSELKPTETVIINLDDELDEGDVEFLDEEILDSDSEDGLNKELEHTDEDTVRNIEREVVEVIGDKDVYSDTNSSREDIQVDKNTRNEADTVRDFVDSDVDDSDLDKDYRVEADTIEDDSMDETDVEDIAGRGVRRSTRNATKTSEKGPSEAILRMLTSKAVVQLEPLTALDIKKWTASRKRPRKD